MPFLDVASSGIGIRFAVTNTTQIATAPIMLIDFDPSSGAKFFTNYATPFCF